MKESAPNSSRQAFWNGEPLASPLIPWRTLRQTVVRSPEISAKISGFRMGILDLHSVTV